MMAAIFGIIAKKQIGRQHIFHTLWFFLIALVFNQKLQKV